MVSSKGDIPERTEVAPSGTGKMNLLCELLERGETIVHLKDGSHEELHGYDTHLFPEEGIIYTQDDEDAEVWFFASEIVELEQH